MPTEWCTSNNIDVYPYLHYTNRFDAWIQAAELLKYYKGHGGSGWNKSDVAKFDKYVRNVMVPMTLAWAGNFGSLYATQNQPLNVEKARMMAGIYLNDEALFQNGYDWMFESNIGNRYGSLKYKGVLEKNYVSIFEMSFGPEGEVMGINRDEGHMNMCVGTIQKVADILWHQKGYVEGYDIYDLKVGDDKTPRFFQSIGWLSKAALEGGAKTSNIGNVTIGKGKLLNFEQIYNHYHYRLKDQYVLPSSFIKYVREQREKGNGGIDALLHADLDKAK